MITVRHSAGLFAVILTGTALAFFVTLERNSTSGRSLISSAAMPVAMTPAPTEKPKGPQVSFMDSPEGSRTLTLERQESNEISSYLLSVSSKSDGQKLQLFKKDESISQNLSIPFNTWSSDNRYVFLKETTPAINNYLVFQSSGVPFASDSAFVSVQELFSKKVPNFIIEDVTGWAGPTSLIVNTRAVEGSSKVSFWFEVPSQSFIQLGTYFK